MIPFRAGSIAIHLCGPWLELNWHLHFVTSNCGDLALRLFEFGPVAADRHGINIGDIIKESGIT
jgi:hypothetical protein